MKYKVKDIDSARALHRYLKTLGLVVSLRDKDAFFELVLVEPENYPLWREICDAFMAGLESQV